MEVKPGYFWIGRLKGEKREGEVGFAIFSLSGKIDCLASINDRIMKLCVPLSCGHYMSMLSVYAPTLQASDDAIMQLYGALRETIIGIPKEEKLILLRDLNARAGRDALGH